MSIAETIQRLNAMPGALDEPRKRKRRSMRVEGREPERIVTEEQYRDNLAYINSWRDEDEVERRIQESEDD